MTDKHELVIDIYPWHATVQILGLTDPNFKTTAIGAGPQLTFTLPEGKYYAIANADGYHAAEMIVQVPENRNPSLHLNPAKTLQSFVPYRMSISNLLIAALALSLTYSVCWGMRKGLVNRTSQNAAVEHQSLARIVLKAQYVCRLHCYAFMTALTAFSLLFFANQFLVSEGSGRLSYAFDTLILSSIGAFIYHIFRAFGALPGAFQESRYQALWRRAFAHLKPSPSRWSYKEVELEKDGSTLHIRSAGDCDYLIHMQFGKGEITKRKGKLEVNSQTQLTQAIRDSKRLLISKQKSSKDEFEKLVTYLPYASSTDWNDRVGLGQIHYICGKPEQLAEQLNFWDEPDRERLESIQRGRETEKKAIEQISQYKPSEWEMKTGMMLSTGNGDVDIMLYLPDRTKIVIDVKNYRGRVYPSNGCILRNDGKTWDNVLKGIKWQAGERRALPIIWQPEAYSKNYFTFQGVHFIAGDVHFLLRQLYKELKIGKVPRVYN